jgi:ketosteroid isomerase-like protein
MTDNERNLRQSYSAYNQGLASAVDLFDARIEWETPSMPPNLAGGKLRGREAVATFFDELRERLSGHRMEIEEVDEAGGDRVIIYGRHHIRTLDTDRTLSMPFVHRWTMRDGHAVAMREYLDPSEYLAAATAAAAR